MLKHPMNSQALRRFTGFFIGLIIIGLGLYWHFSEITKLQQQIQTLENQNKFSEYPAPANQTPAFPLDGKIKVYNNKTHNFNLNYPEYFDITTYNSDNAIIGIGNPSNSAEPVNGKISLKVFTTTTNLDKTEQLKDFIENKATNLCTTSGGGISVTCPKVKNFASFTLTSGLTGYSLVLEREEKTIGPEASIITDESVFFIVDLSTEKEKVILVIYPIGDGTPELARSIAETVTTPN